MSKIILEEISIRNFNSFGDAPQTFRFPNKGIYRLLGKNADVTPESVGLNSLQSGAGKSTFFSSLAFAITGDVPGKRSKDSLINKKSKKNLHVSLVFKKNKDRYKIDRYRRHSKYSNRLLLYKEDNGVWNDITLEDLSFTQEYINKIFGVNFDVLLKTTILARDGSRNFLDLPTHERTQVIENIIQLDKLKEYAQKIKDKLREARKQHEYVNLDLSECFGSVKTLKQLILQEIESKRNKRLTIQNRINEIEKDLNKAKINFKISKDFLADVKRIRNLQDNKEQQEKLLKSFHSKNDPYSLPNLYNKYQSWKNTYLDEVVELNALKNSKGEVCPHCKKELNEKKRLQKIADKEKLNKKDRDLLSERISLFRKRVTEYRKAREELEKKSNAFANSIDEFDSKYEITFDNWTSNLETVYEDNTHLHDEIDERRKELKSFSSIENILSMREKWRNKRRDLSEISSKKKEIADEIAIGEYWDAAFDFRNEGSIKSYIINKIIPVFNNILSGFISVMFNGQMTVTFNNSFEETILYNGEIYDYNQLSTGEKARLNICIAFSIFNMTRMNLVSINVMFLDEMFAGMDNHAVKKLIDIIKNGYSKQLSIFVTGYESGIDEALIPDGIITIKKEGGESFIE